MYIYIKIIEKSFLPEKANVTHAYIGLLVFLPSTPLLATLHSVLMLSATITSPSLPDCFGVGILKGEISMCCDYKSRCRCFISTVEVTKHSIHRQCTMPVF